MTKNKSFCFDQNNLNSSFIYIDIFRELIFKKYIFSKSKQYIFSDPAVQALQFLDVISMKDPSQKAQFFRTTLTDIFPYIPRVILKMYSHQKWNRKRENSIFMFQKLWFQHTWPVLEQEIRSQEVLAAVLEPVLFLVKECSPEEYGNIILPALK